MGAYLGRGVNLHIGFRRGPWGWPAYGAEVQATQLVCVKGDFPAEKLTKEIVDKWFQPGSGTPMAGQALSWVPRHSQRVLRLLQ